MTDEAVQAAGRAYADWIHAIHSQEENYPITKQSAYFAAKDAAIAHYCSVNNEATATSDETEPAELGGAREPWNPLKLTEAQRLFINEGILIEAVEHLVRLRIAANQHDGQGHSK